MVWRFVTPVGIGDSQRFGGADINKIMQLFSGVADVDTVSINSNWFFQNNRLAILSPDGQSSSALQVDNVPTGPGVQRTTIIPSQEQATDYISIRKQTEELEHKTIDTTKNTLKSTGATLGNILKSDVSGMYLGFPRGTASQSLRVNSAGTDLAWVTEATASEKLYNKDLTDASNIFPAVGTGALVVPDNSVTDAKVATQTSTKITILNKAQLNTSIAYKDETNWLTDAMVFGSAAIAKSKLGPLSIGDADIVPHLSTKIQIANKAQLNALIAYKDESGWLTDAMVSATAAIQYIKLNLTNSIRDTDVNPHTSTKITITAKAQLNSAIAYNDQGNTFGAFDQIFRSSNLKIRNPANTFSNIIVSSAITADRQLAIPLLTADDTINVLGLAQTITGVKTFLDQTLLLRNAANTVSAKIVLDPALLATRSFILPSIGSDGTLACLEGSQTFSGLKTFAAQTTYNVTAVSGGTEILATYKVSDDAASTLRISNASGQDGHFGPGINSNYLGNLSNVSALSLTGQTDPGQDVSTAAAVLNLISKNSDSTFLANRKLFQISNYTKAVLTINGDGSLDLHNNKFVNTSLGGMVSSHQYGGFVPDENNPGDGVLRGLTVVKPDAGSITIQPLDSFFVWSFLFTSPGAGFPVQLYTSRYIAYPNHNPRIRILPYLAAPNQDHRFYCGWTDIGEPLPESDTPLDGITAGILIGFRPDDTNWMVFHSDGEGTGMQVFDTGVQKGKSNVIRDFELKSVIASNKWTINPIHTITTGATPDPAAPNVPQDITTSVPITNQPLAFHCEFQSKYTNTARQLRIIGLEAEVGTLYGGSPA